MTDEKYVFMTEVADKKRTARGVHNKRTHTGKRGKLRFPSDNMTRKEIEAMNGEVKTYNIKNPMKWHEFKTMPDDLKRAYLKRLRDLYNASNKAIGDMMGVSDNCIGKEARRLGIRSLGKNERTLPEWNSFVKYGSPERKTEEQVEEAVCETVDAEAACDMEQPEEVSFDWTPEGGGSGHTPCSVEVAPGGLDYKDMYYMAEDRWHKAQEEHYMLTEKLKAVLEENKILEAKLSIVNLIFGGNK